MSEDKTQTPKVFISYSWTSPEHEEWVLELAKRLKMDGIMVVFDKWSLKEGHDVNAFMESSVNSPDINKVIIVCDRGYMEKANSRSGGVGTETLIISPEIYNNVQQEKFIPVVSESDSTGNAFIPTFVNSRLYINMSGERYEEGYDRLVRNIYGKPLYPEPELGKRPKWLEEEEVQHHKTVILNRRLKDAIDKNPARVKGIIREFFEETTEALEGFHITEVKRNEPLDEEVYNMIKKMLPLRDDYIEFLDILCSYFEELDIDPIVGFFEGLYRFTEAPEGINAWQNDQFGHYTFFIQEILLYTVMVLLDSKHYRETSDLLYTLFYIRSRFNGSTIKRDFRVFYSYLRILDEIRNKRLDQRKISLTSEILIQRTTKKYNRDKLVQADLLLFYISVLKGDGSPWFPRSYVYAPDLRLPIFEKLISRRHFEKVKSLFGVDTKEQLIDKFKQFQNPYQRGYQTGLSWIKNLNQHINPDDIGSQG